MVAAKLQLEHFTSISSIRGFFIPKKEWKTQPELTLVFFEPVLEGSNLLILQHTIKSRLEAPISCCLLLWTSASPGFWGDHSPALSEPPQLDSILCLVLSWLDAWLEVLCKIFDVCCYKLGLGHDRLQSWVSQRKDECFLQQSFRCSLASEYSTSMNILQQRWPQVLVRFYAIQPWHSNIKFLI